MMEVPILIQSKSMDWFATSVMKELNIHEKRIQN